MQYSSWQNDPSRAQSKKQISYFDLQTLWLSWSLLQSWVSVYTTTAFYIMCFFFFESSISRRKKFPLKLAEGCLALRLSLQTSLHCTSHCKNKRYTQKYKQGSCIWARNKPFDLFRTLMAGMDFGKVLFHPDTSSDDCTCLCLHMRKYNWFISWRECWFLLFYSILALAIKTD